MQETDRLRQAELALASSNDDKLARDVTLAIETELTCFCATNNSQ
jgi:hypothetical protein